MHRRLHLINTRNFPSLIGKYRFDGDYNDDFSPKSNLDNGGITGFSFMSGKYGQALYRDNTMGTGTRLSITNIDKYSFTNGVNDLPYSISLWVKIIGVGTSYGVLVGKNAIGLGNQNNNAEYLLALTTANRLYFQKWSEGNTANWDRFTTVNILPKNEWLHIIVTDDSLGNVKIYINGALQASTKTTQGTGFIKYSKTTDSRFGIFSSPAANAITYFYGWMEDLLVFNKELNTDEILKIYNSNISIK